MVGNSSNFTPYDVVSLFALLSEGRTGSRADIASTLGIGEGSVRNMLNHLKKKRFIHSNYAGHSLTTKGKALAAQFKERIQIMSSVPTFLYRQHKLRNCCILYHPGHDLPFSIMQRDLAIKNGGEACLVFVYDGAKLRLPHINLSKMPSDFDHVFPYQKNDILIVAFARTERLARHAGVSVATSFLEEDGITIRKKLGLKDQ